MRRPRRVTFALGRAANETLTLPYGCPGPPLGAVRQKNGSVFKAASTTTIGSQDPRRSPRRRPPPFAAQCPRGGQLACQRLIGLQALSETPSSEPAKREGTLPGRRKPPNLVLLTLARELRARGRGSRAATSVGEVRRTTAQSRWPGRRRAGLLRNCNLHDRIKEAGAAAGRALWHEMLAAARTARLGRGPPEWSAPLSNGARVGRARKAGARKMRHMGRSALP
jgi:hypothetical protein